MQQHNSFSNISCLNYTIIRSWIAVTSKLGSQKRCLEFWYLNNHWTARESSYLFKKCFKTLSFGWLVMLPMPWPLPCPSLTGWLISIQQVYSPSSCQKQSPLLVFQDLLTIGVLSNLQAIPSQPHWSHPHITHCHQQALGSLIYVFSFDLITELQIQIYKHIKDVLTKISINHS